MTEPRSNPIVACLAGDGIGPEVMAEAGRVIEAVSSLMGARVRQVHLPFGGDAIDKHQHPFPSHVRAAVRASDAVLLGAVGGPRWETAPRRPEAGLIPSLSFGRGPAGKYVVLLKGSRSPGLVFSRPVPSSVRRARARLSSDP